jgi:hypothetical protein
LLNQLSKGSESLVQLDSLLTLALFLLVLVELVEALAPAAV